MTRFTFGGQLPDTVAGLYNATALTGTPGLTLLASLTGITVTAWTAPVGGVQVTDLLDSTGSPTSMIAVVNATITQFQGPNDSSTTALWMDAGGPRALLLANNPLDARVANLESIAGLGSPTPYASLVTPAFSGPVTIDGVVAAKVTDVATAIGGLATVAASGAYGDLLGTPTIPPDSTAGIATNTTALAALPAAYKHADPVMAITYNGDGTVAAVTEDGIATTFTYNADGTIHTQTRSGVTRAYAYSGGNLTGVS